MGTNSGVLDGQEKSACLHLSTAGDFQESLVFSFFPFFKCIYFESVRERESQAASADSADPDARAQTHEP